ncbi:hypothetical protein [Pedobacter faecalis]|uniref:hypothetical protein n=1 Tax=Pedobacter faecalis TaxID=3041495 RepID=UPI00254EE05A|nr:hypothetical protein [Pedobacter sp. ELA7]
MDPFIIKVNGTVLTVYPQEDGSFNIFWNGEQYANIFADIDGDTMEPIWSTGDLVSLEEVQAIGEAIERFEK